MSNELGLCLRHPTLFLLLHAQPSAFSAVPVSNAAVAVSVVSILQTPVHRLWEDEGLCCTNNNWGKAEQMEKTDFCCDWKKNEAYRLKRLVCREVKIDQAGKVLLLRQLETV
ncbi:hypothetical protein P8452_47939 [Trifolium repens]|nr:hypothetical protein P8452_47939 [Trifolium repens]